MKIVEVDHVNSTLTLADLDNDSARKSYSFEGFLRAVDTNLTKYQPSAYAVNSTGCSLLPVTIHCMDESRAAGRFFGT